MKKLLSTAIIIAMMMSCIPYGSARELAQLLDFEAPTYIAGNDFQASTPAGWSSFFYGATAYNGTSKIVVDPVDSNNQALQITITKSTENDKTIHYGVIGLNADEGSGTRDDLFAISGRVYVKDMPQDRYHSIFARTFAYGGKDQLLFYKNKVVIKDGFFEGSAWKDRDNVVLINHNLTWIDYTIVYDTSEVKIGEAVSADNRIKQTVYLNGISYGDTYYGPIASAGTVTYNPAAVDYRGYIKKDSGGADEGYSELYVDDLRISTPGETATVFVDSPAVTSTDVGYVNVSMNFSEKVDLTNAKIVAKKNGEAGAQEITPTSIIMKSKSVNLYFERGLLDYATDYDIEYSDIKDIYGETVADGTTQITTGEEPEPLFELSNMKITNSVGEEVGAIPTNKDFVVEVAAKKLTNTSLSMFLIIAAYDQNNSFVDLTYLKGNYNMDQTIEMGTMFQQKPGSEITKVKAFAWDSLRGNLKAYSNTLQFPPAEDPIEDEPTN